MKNILTILKLDFTMFKNNNLTKKKAVPFIFSLIFLSIALFFLGTLLADVFEQASTPQIVSNFLSLMLFIMQLAIFLFALSRILKKIFFTKDKLLLARLPISKWQIYLAKLIWCFIFSFLLNLILCIGFLIPFAISFNLSTSFYWLISIAVLLLPLFPFSLASLMAVPIMFLQNFLKNKNLLNLIVNILVTIVAFLIYSRLVFTMADFIFLEHASSGNILRDIANVFSSNFFPSMWLAQIMLNSAPPLCYIGLICLSLILPVLSTLLGASTFKKIFIRAIIEKTVARTIISNKKVRTPFMSYFITEFKDLFRSSTYSYTYFGMAVAMPIMVWLCNQFMVSFAVERLGENIMFGTTLLVVLVFISIICSPSASFLSKEGDSYWIIKTNPNGIRTPLLAKSLVGFLSATCALVITSLVLLIAGYVSALQTLIIFLLSILYMSGLICCGLIINLCKPNLFKGNLENNSNTMTLMLLSFILSLTIGIACILLTFINSLNFAILISSVCILAFCLISICLLFILYPKLYAKMEV